MVNLTLEVNSFQCSLDLVNKVTFIKGNSGVGKTTLINYLSRKGIEDFVSISEGYNYEILIQDRFKDILNNAIKVIERDTNISFKDIDTKKRKKVLKDYWDKDSVNFPYQDKIIFIDDEDFVNTTEFTAFFDADKYNYYVIINRIHLDTIGYSVDSVFDLVTDGIKHYLKQRYILDSDSIITDFDYIVTEGISSDYIFFKSWWGSRVINPMFNEKLESGGRSNVAKMLELNKDIFNGKSLFILIDYVAFGSNFESLIEVCKNINATFYITSTYKSFEYLLLNTNLINDLNLINFVEANKLKFNSLENLYTFRLEQLTKNSLFSYSKRSDSFPICYYKNCCSNNKYRPELCSLRLKFSGNKLHILFKGTIFEFLLEMIPPTNKEVD